MLRKMRNYIVFFCTAVLACVGVYRVINAPDIGSAIFGFILTCIFLCFLFFLLFESRIKQSKLYERIDSNFLSATYVVHGNTWNLASLSFFTLGSYFLLFLFCWGLYKNFIPIQEWNIIAFGFIAIGLLWLIGVVVLFITPVFLHIKTHHPH